MRILAATGLLLIAAAWASALLHQRSGSVAWLTSLALIAAAAVSASGLHSSSWRTRLWPALAVGLLLAAMANALTAMLQTWAPAWLPAGIPLPGPGQRVGGLVAQANHLGMLMVWALLALGGWLHLRRWPLAVGLAVLLPLAIGLVLSGSRTAALAWLLAGGALLFAGSPALRRLGVGAWGLAGLAFAVVSLTQPDAGPAALATHLQQGSPSRWPLLLGTLELIARYPLTGTGWGEFNAAWMLSPRDAATPLLVHHSHNLVLQLLAELGLPLGLLLLLLLLAAIGLQGRAAWQARHNDDPLPWLAWAMVLAVLLHSQLELPLWHAHWLLPAAFLLAWATPAAAPGHAPARRLAYAGLLLLLLAVLVLREWLRVLPVHAAPPDAPPIALRIAEAKHSWLFSPWAWQAEAMDPDSVQRDFARGAEVPFGPLYLIAWAQQLERQGDGRRADFLMARVRDVGGAHAEWLSKRCRIAPQGEFPCRASTAALSPLDFLPAAEPPRR